MSTHSPDNSLHQQPAAGSEPSTSSNKHIVTNFTSPQFRSKVIEIISETANGCLQELNCQPGVGRRLAELQTLTSKYQEENKRLFEDNRRLALMAKDVQSKLHSFEQFHERRVQSMEQQITALHKENQEVLTRERRLAAGFPEYAQLHDDHTRLQAAYVHLKQQMLALQRYVQEQPRLASNQPMVQALHPQIQNPALEGGQSASARVPLSVQEAWKKDLQPPAQGQIPQPQQNVLAPGQQKNTVSRQTRPQITIPNGPSFSSPRPQPSQSGNPKTNAPIQHISPANQQHKVPAPSRPSSSSSSHSPSVPSPIYAQGFKMPGQPVIHGWGNGHISPWSTSSLGMIPPSYVNTPAGVLPRHLVPAPFTQVQQPPPYSQHQYQPQQMPHLPQPQPPPHPLQSSPPPKNRPLQIHPASTPASASASPIIPGQASNGIGPHQSMINTSAGVPILPPPKDIPVAPIGPAGKLLPPLLGAYVKPGSPTSSSRSGNTPRPTPTSPSGSRDGNNQTSTPTPTANPTGSTTVDPRKNAPKLIESPVRMVSVPPDTSRSSAAVPEQNPGDVTHTPHLTPSSSRASIGPSEGVPEAVTPRDTPVNHFVGVVGSPAAEGGQGMDIISPSEGMVTLSTLTKRPSVHMDSSEDVEAPLASLARKKLRLEGATDISSTKEVPDNGAAVPPVASKEIVTGEMTVNNPTAAVLSDAMEEDDPKDVDEEDEFEPDGTRPIRYCLEMFTDEINDGIVTCLLCSARHEMGLINQPAKFTPDTPQEERVEHFVNEHPTAWEDLLHGRNG